MPDFSLLREHPWATVGIVGGGGLLLFIVMRRGGSAAPAGGTGGVVYNATDPNATAQATALQAQQDQIAGSVQGLSIQGQTQVALAQLAAQAQNYTVAASQDVTNKQTDAELQLGLGTLSTQVQSQQIQAGVQMAYINAIVAAFTGNNPTGSPVTNPGTVVSNPSTASNPINQNPSPVPVTVTPPTYNGGSQYIVPLPNYSSCDPRDVNCVNNNQQLNVGWVNNVLSQTAANNKAQCLANAALSVGKPNYNELVAACG